MARRLLIQGRVQGVGFRYWAQQQAQALALTGWVRNRKDGAVEALIFGAPENLDAMVLACHAGPHFAQVTQVDVSDVAQEEASKSGVPALFEIKVTV